MAPSEQALVFRCGGEPLVGVLHRPPGGPQRVGVLIVVGGPQYRVGSHRQFVLMARSLAAAGHPVLRFDYRGMGDSGAPERGFERVDDDIQAAIDLFERSVPQLQGVVLWGLCDAAAACAMYCGRQDRRVRGLILVNPWVRTNETQAQTYLRHYYGQRLLQRSFWRKALTGGLDFTRALREWFVTLRQARAPESAAATRAAHFRERMLEGLGAHAGPALVLASGRDLVAKEFLDLCARERAWRNWLRQPRTRLVHLQDADHTFSSRTDLGEATSQCLTWLSIAADEPRTRTEPGTYADPAARTIP